MERSHRAALVVALARSAITSQPVPDGTIPALSDAVCRELFVVARQNGLLPMVHAGAGVSGIALPSGSVAGGQQAVWFATVRCAQAWKEAAPIFGALNVVGIDAALLKGVFLATRHYPQPYLRPFGDIDFLVQPSHRDQACSILLDLGYKCTDDMVADGKAWSVDNHYHWKFVRDASMTVELHWKLGFNFPRTSDEFNEIWSRTEYISTPIGEARVLSSIDEVISLAVHMTTHCFRLPLRSHADFAAILTSFTAAQWDELWVRGTYLGRERELLAVLGVGHELGFLTLDAEVLSRIRRDGSLDIPFLTQYAADYPNVVAPDRLLDIRNAKSKRASVVRLFRAAFPRYTHLWTPAVDAGVHPMAIYGSAWSRRAVRILGYLRNVRKFTADCRRANRVHKMFLGSRKFE